jgi:hypothetical protein
MGARLQYHKGGLTIKQITNAQSQTTSHNQAAAFLGVSIPTYVKYAKIYNLYDSWEHKGGKGTKKPRKKGVYGLQDILDGKYPNYHRPTLKERLIAVGWLEYHCRYCGYSKKRPDGRGPMIMVYVDGDKNNLQLQNLALECYNCHYYNSDHKITAFYGPDGVTKVNDEESEVSPEELMMDNQLSPEEIEELQNALMLPD